MRKLIMMKGLPGSGKSFWASEYLKKDAGVISGQKATKIISKDSIRRMIDNGKHSHGREKLVIKTRDTLINLYLSEGHSVIVDDTNLAYKHEERLRQLARENNAEFFITSFTDVTLETCIKRDLQRQHSVGERVITGMYNQFLMPYKEQEYKPKRGAIPAIICDLDGTLCILGDRSPYDGANCHLDTLNKDIAEILEDLWEAGNSIIFMSGRHDTHREITEQWLQDHVGIEYTLLLMRKEGDNRSDDVIKKELFLEHVAPNYRVVAAIDDRKRVIRLWKSLGITVFDVGPGYEF
jgi:predicted kinase